MSHRLFVPVSIALILTFLPSAIAQTARKVTPVIPVKGSNVLIEVGERSTQSPSLTPVELAAYGNELIARKGFDYEFDVCEMLNHDRTKSIPDKIVRNHQMTLTNGGKLTFRFTIGDGFESLCSECWSLIPGLQVTSKEMTLIAEGKRYRVRRPPTFLLDEAHLVDASLKKVIRTWQMPYQAMPTGISPDGTKLYLDFYPGNGLDDLVLEISENGPPQFRHRAVIESSEGKFIENHPKDPTNGYLSFMSFRVGQKTYRVKFSAPCT